MSESSDLSAVFFYGKDAKECYDFIGLVRTHAYKSDKMDDDAWIAKQVYACFRGKALGWYLKQPRDVRGDWEILQQALIQEWPLTEEESSNQPTPPAGPPSADFGVSLKGRGIHAAARRTGIIRITLPTDPSFLGYLSKKISNTAGWDGIRGSFTVTTDRQESLEVKLLPTQTPNLWRLGVKDFPEVEYLAAYFCGDKVKSYAGVIIGVQQAPTGRTVGESTTYAATGPRFRGHIYRTDVWKISNQGIMTCRWPEQGSASTAININLHSKKDLVLREHSNVFVSLTEYQKAELVFVDAPF